MRFLTRLARNRKSGGLTKRVAVAALVAVIAGTVALSGITLDFSSPPGSVDLGGGQVTLRLGSAEAAGTVDYVLTPTNCNVPVQQALDALPAFGGELKFVSTGTFDFSASVLRAVDNVVVNGPGLGLYFTYDDSTAIFDAGTQSNWVFKNFRTDSGGCDVGTATDYTYQNVLLGATYVSYDFAATPLVAGSPLTGMDIEGTPSTGQAATWYDSDTIEGSNFAGSYTVMLAADDSTTAEKVAALASGGRVCSSANDEADFVAVDADDVSIFLGSGNYIFDSQYNPIDLDNVRIYANKNATIHRSFNGQTISMENCNNFIWDGIIFTSDDENDNFGEIQLIECEDIWVQNCKFYNSYTFLWIQCNTVSHAKCYRIHILNNEFTDFDYASILLGNGIETVEIRGNVFHDATAEGSLLYAIATLDAAGQDTTSPTVDYLDITDNQFRNHNSHNAIDVHGANYVNITNNFFDNIAQNAIYGHTINQGTVTEFRAWNFSGNTFVDCVNAAISIDCENTVADVPIEGLIINGNTIIDCEQDPILIGVSAVAGCAINNLHVTNNNIYGHAGVAGGDNGIECVDNQGASIGLIIQSNTVIGTGGTDRYQYGIYPKGFVSTLVDDNYVYDCDYGAITGSGSGDDVTFSNNIFEDCNVGIRVYDGDDVIISGCRFMGCSTPISMNTANAVRTFVTGNDWEGCTNDISYGAAVNPIIVYNVDKSGVLVTGTGAAVDVFGTPVDGEVAVWTDSDTVEGSDIGTYFIAADDATDAEKVRALASGGIVCDNTQDFDDINTAITAGERNIELSTGTFTDDTNSVTYPNAAGGAYIVETQGTIIRGAGRATVLNYTNTTGFAVVMNGTGAAGNAATNHVLEDVCIKAPNTTGGGVSNQDAAQNNIVRVLIRTIGANGIGLYQGGDNVGANIIFYDRVMVSGCNGYAFYGDGDNNQALMEGCFLFNDSATKATVYFKPEDDNGMLTMENCEVRNTGAGGTFYVEDAELVNFNFVYNDGTDTSSFINSTVNVKGSNVGGVGAGDGAWDHTSEFDFGLSNNLGMLVNEKFLPVEPAWLNRVVACARDLEIDQSTINVSFVTDTDSLVGTAAQSNAAAYALAFQHSYRYDHWIPRGKYLFWVRAKTATDHNEAAVRIRNVDDTDKKIDDVKLELRTHYTTWYYPITIHEGDGWDTVDSESDRIIVSLSEDDGNAVAITADCYGFRYLGHELEDVHYENTISCIIDHADIIDDGGASGHIDFTSKIPALSIIEMVRIDYTEAFNSDNTTTLLLEVGISGGDTDAFNLTLNGENAFNTTTDVSWGQSDCQDYRVTSESTIRLEFTEDDDITDIISDAGCQGTCTVYITYISQY